MGYDRLVWIVVTAFAVLFLCFGKNATSLAEESVSTRRDTDSFELTDLISDAEMYVLGQRFNTPYGGGPEVERMRAEMHRPEVYRPLLEERFALWNLASQRLEREFMRLSLLGGVAKKVTLMWYENEERHPADGPYVPNDDNLRTHIVADEDVSSWRFALSPGGFRPLPALSLYGAYEAAYSVGTEKHVPVPPDAIVFETDKEEIFVGITPFAFHLGKWESNKIQSARFFYSPILARCLDEYVRKHKLEHFPKIHIDALSGKNIIRQWDIDSYPVEKAEFIQKEAGDGTHVEP